MDRFGHGRAFQRKDDIGKAAVLQKLRVTHGAAAHGFRRVLAIQRQELLFDRAAVDADADRDVMRLAAVRDHAHALGRADVARVDAQLVHAVFNRRNRKAVVEMHVGNERNPDLLLDGLDCRCCRLIEHCDTDDLAPRLFEPVDLRNRRFDVARVRVAHGLDRDRRAAADLHRTDLYKICHLNLRSSAKDR